MTNQYEPDVFESPAFADDAGGNAPGLDFFIDGPCEDTCDWCGAKARWVRGRFGPFIACSKYPKCKWTVKKTRISQTQEKLDGVAVEKAA